MLTEKEAWQRIATAYRTTPENRSLEQHDITKFGICRAASRLLLINEISFKVCDQIEIKSMFEVIKRHGDKRVYLCDVDDRNSDIIRAEFCEQQAALCDDEKI